MTETSEDAVRQTLGLQRRRVPVWVWVLGVLVVLVGGGLALWQPGSASRRAGNWDYEVEPVIRDTLVVRVDAVGTLEPEDAVSVGSELSGIVTAVHAEENQEVEAGELLVELDRKILAAQSRQAGATVDASEAAVAQAMVTVDATRQDLARARTLHASRTISDAALEQAETAHRQAVAAVAQAEAQLAQSRAAHQAARTNLEKTRITAPIDGVVLERSVEPGQAVVSSLQAATLFRLAGDLHQMQVVVEVDEADVGRVKPGQPADFTVPAFSDRVFEAVVEEVHLAPTGTSDVVTYQAVLTVENPELELLPGMTASVGINAAEYPEALLVPNRSLRFTPEGEDASRPPPREGRRVERVWVLEGESLTSVEVLPVATDGRRTAIEGEGLTAGQSVVIGATPRRGRKKAAE